MKSRTILILFFCGAICSCDIKRTATTEDYAESIVSTFKQLDSNRFINDAINTYFRAYQLAEVEEAQKLYNSCVSMIKADTNLDSIMRMLAYDEMVSTAASSHVSWYNKIFKKVSLVSYSDYITGSILYLLEPTVGLIDVANQEIKVTSDSTEMNRVSKLVKNIQTSAEGKIVTDPSFTYSNQQSKAFVYCMLLDLHLGLVGADTYSKRMSKNVSDIFGKRIIKNLRQRFN